MAWLSRFIISDPVYVEANYPFLPKQFLYKLMNNEDIKIAVTAHGSQLKPQILKEKSVKVDANQGYQATFTPDTDGNIYNSPDAWTVMENTLGK